MYNTEFDKYFNALDKFFMPLAESVKRNPAKESFDFHEHLMRADIKEEENNFIIDVNLPGYKKDDIKIELKNDYLIVSADIVEEKEETKQDKFVKRERYSGSCKRSFYIGEVPIKKDEISASLENGVLKIIIPKGEEEKEEKVLISIK